MERLARLPGNLRQGAFQIERFIVGLSKVRGPMAKYWMTR